MKKTIITTAMMSCSAIIAQSATLVEAWNFDDATAGGSLTTAKSSVTTSLSFSDNALTEASNPAGTALVIADGTTESMFSNKVTSVGSVTTGIYQISWDVVAADFTNTAAADGRGQLGFGLFDDNGAAANVSDVALFQFNAASGQNRFRIDGTDILSTAEGGSKTDGSTIANLNIRSVYNLDDDDVDIYYTLGAGPEQFLKNRAIPTGIDFEAMRIQIQTINGGNSWAAGDSVEFDNLEITQIPEPSSSAFLGLSGLVLILRRRR